MHFKAKGMRRCRLPLDFRHPPGIAGEPQAAVHFPARGKAGFLFKAAIEIDGMLQKLGDIGRSSELSDKARRMPGRTGRELRPLKNDDILLGGGASNNAAANDDDPRLRGNGSHSFILEFSRSRI
jgi:hypothetical protein